MPRVNQNASVTIRINGLAIAHHNEDSGNWEFLFLRGIPDHDLKITIRKYDETSNIPVEKEYLIPIDEKKIEINSTGATPQAPYFLTERFAGRVTVDNDHDARWVIDLSEDLHNAPVKLERKKGRNGKPIPLTFLSVSNAVFYTDTLARRPYQIVKNGEEALEPRLTGGWIGLDIQWSNDESQTQINFESMNPQILKPESKVSIYEIEINNDCSKPESNTSDFHYYYDYLISMPDEFKQFVPSSINTSSTMSFALFGNDGDNSGPGKDDCNPPRIARLEGIASLEELISNA